MDFYKLRKQMVNEQIMNRGIRNKRIIKAMLEIPREKFISKKYRMEAYFDRPLPIEHSQTISQPYIVARLCDLLELNKKDRVLDIGTGSGYQAAVLSRIVKQVVTVEIIEELSRSAEKIFKKLKYDNIILKIADGRQGAEEYQPFDGIVSAAVCQQIPTTWKKQLTDGGRIVCPVKQGWYRQQLVKLNKKNNKFKQTEFDMVNFVPLV